MEQEKQPEAKSMVTIEGLEYEIPSLNLDPESLADEIDQHLSQGRFEPMEALVRGIERLNAMKRPDLIETLTTAAFRDLRQEKKPHLNPQEVAAWLGTLDGASWIMWRQLSAKYPEITHAKVKAELLRQQLAAQKSQQAQG